MPRRGIFRWRFWTGIAVALTLSLGTLQVAQAALERVGPVDATNGGYPAWYQDTTGLTLEFCKPTTQAELNDGWCLILPPDVPNGAVPEVPFTNYSAEHFYWNATAGSATQGAILVLGLEGAFGTAPAAGDQLVFGRLRIKLTTVPFDGDYKVYTPYGDFSFPGLVAGERLFFTSDIGITCGTSFDCALASQVGPFLLPSATTGGVELPPIPDLVKGSGVDPFYDALAAATPYPGTGKKYISDPARLGPVTGSPLPPFVGNDGATYNHNVFRIEGPNGFVVHETDFTTMGRVMSGALAARVTVNRASYSASNAGTKLDVFATAIPATQGRLPGGTLPATLNPDLGFYDAPCSTDPTTGVVTGPPADPGLLYYQMFRSGNRWWGQDQPAVIPGQVCVQDKNARNAAGAVVTAYFLGDVADEVDITVADWNPTVNGGTLTVAAASSDQLTAPALAVAGFGPIDSGTGQLVLADVAAPPAKVTVTSARGGVATLDVRTSLGTPVSTSTPVANADSVSTPEDTAVANFNLLSNDTLNGAPLAPGAGTVTITGHPQLGIVTLNGDQTVTYTPNANVNGTDLIGYTVTVNGVTSPEGYLTVLVTPANDPPVAVNDTTSTPRNRAITINVLANDTDADGKADLANAVIKSLPPASVNILCNGALPGAVGTVCSGGLITLTPTVQGSFTFTYAAQDQSGVQSANAATVTLNVSAAEAIVVTRSNYIVKANRWRVDGTDSVPADQTLTITYADGTYRQAGACTGSAAGAVIGTATVDALGNWSFDAILTSSGVLNPTNTLGNSTGFWCTPPQRITVTSPLGGRVNSAITRK